MTRNRPRAMKLRLLRRAKGNRRVPAWVMLRTSRRFVRHPKRHQWRRSKLDKG